MQTHVSKFMLYTGCST